MKIKGYVVKRLTSEVDCDGVAESWKISGKGGARWADLVEDLNDQLEARCYCQHDCCGHLNGGIWKVTERRGALIIKTRYVRNI